MLIYTWVRDGHTDRNALFGPFRGPSIRDRLAKAAGYSSSTQVPATSIARNASQICIHLC